MIKIGLPDAITALESLIVRSAYNETGLLKGLRIDASAKPVSLLDDTFRRVSAVSRAMTGAHSDDVSLSR